MKRLLAGVMAAGILGLSGCGNDSGPAHSGQRSETAEVDRADYVGTWGKADQGARSPSYTFDTDGTYRAFDGCNSEWGKWTFEDPEVSIQPDGGSTVECQDFVAAQTAVIEAGKLAGQNKGKTLWSIPRTRG